MTLPPGHYDNDPITGLVRSRHGAAAGEAVGMTPTDRYIRPQARSAALVLIDMQRDFLDVPGGDAPMPVAGTGAVIAAIAKLASAFRRRGGSANCRAGQSRFADCRRAVAQSR
jgi:isochorismate hydrolase